MRFIEELCPPALLYLIFMAVNVGLDLSLGMWITAGVKLFGGIAGVIVLNGFCSVDLGIVSWVVMAMPFIVTALGTSIAMGLQLDRTITHFAVEAFTNPNSDAKVNALGAGEPPISTSAV